MVQGCCNNIINARCFHWWAFFVLIENSAVIVPINNLLIGIKTNNPYLWYMRAHKYEPNYTLADYDMWEGNWELIDGYPYAMSPSASTNHQRVANKVNVQLVASLEKLKGSCDSCEVFYELDWRINIDTVVKPDLAIVCNLTEKFINKPPVLLVELLSASTALLDRHIKYELYQEQGVPYYIIIDPETRQYNIFVLTKGKYLERNDITIFDISNTCSFELDLGQVLAEVKLR